MSAVMEEQVRFGEKGVYLAGLLHHGRNSSPGIVLLHPHPTLGGDMNFYLLADLVREFSKERITTLRFNYRGVPPSTGTYGGGSGELEDTLKAVEFIRNQQNVNKEHVALVGYSFGGSLALMAAERAKVKAVVSISPQVNPSETRLDTTEYARRITCPVLLIHGKADETVPYSDSEKIYDALVKSVEKDIELVDGANHMYSGKGKNVVYLATTFLETFL
jgi:hypothetical protein